jgi:glycerophosphoryl diester phosphodiesterase
VNPYEGLDDAEASGAWIPGPPWILGHRGTPHEAPENTLAGMRRAVDVALDGFEYDLRACASGEAVLLHDATLERTTDATGALAARSLPELFGIDAGAWFAKRYAGEPLALFDEVLEIAGSDGQGWPLHMIELKERGLVGRVAEKLRELAPQLDVRVASFLRDVVLEARDAELPSMLLAVSADADDRSAPAAGRARPGRPTGASASSGVGRRTSPRTCSTPAAARSSPSTRTSPTAPSPCAR